MGNQNWERVEEDSPLRCQAVIPTKGQCINKKMEGSDYCPAHGGNRGNSKLKREQKRMYMIERYQQKLDAMQDHEGIKSLTSEIAVLRMILETRLKGCKDDMDLMLHSQSISNLVVNIEKLVTSCNRLDSQLGNMLDTTQAIQWMNAIVDIIGSHITDDDVLAEISDEILESYDLVLKGKA